MGVENKGIHGGHGQVDFALFQFFHSPAIVGVVVLQDKLPAGMTHGGLHFRRPQWKVTDPVVQGDGDLSLGFPGVAGGLLLVFLKIRQQVPGSHNGHGPDNKQ